MSFAESWRLYKHKHIIFPTQLGLQPCRKTYLFWTESPSAARSASVLTQKDPSFTATKDCTSPPFPETSSDEMVYQINLRLTWPVISLALHRNGHQTTSDFTITSALQKVPKVAISQALHLHLPNNLFHLLTAMQSAWGQRTPGLAWSGQKIYFKMLAMYLKYRNIFGGNTKFSASIWGKITRISLTWSATACSMLRSHLLKLLNQQKLRIWVTLIKILVLED